MGNDKKEKNLATIFISSHLDLSPLKIIGQTEA
jgi:hypothetical protein